MSELTLEQIGWLEEWAEAPDYEGIPAAKLTQLCALARLSLSPCKDAKAVARKITSEATHIDEAAAMIDAYARSLVPEVPEDVKELAVSLMVQCTKEIKGYDPNKAARLITAFMEKQRPPNQDFNRELATLEALGRFDDPDERIQSDRDIGRFVAGAEWQSRRQGLVIESPDTARDASIRKEAEEKAKLKWRWDGNQLKIGKKVFGEVGFAGMIPYYEWVMSGYIANYPSIEEAKVAAEIRLNEFIASLSAEEGA